MEITKVGRTNIYAKNQNGWKEYVFLINHDNGYGLEMKSRLRHDCFAFKTKQDLDNYVNYKCSVSQINMKFYRIVSCLTVEDVAAIIEIMDKYERNG